MPAGLLTHQTMYTILDTETASLNGGIVELAMLHLDENLNVVGEFHKRINPERPIEPGAQAVHGICDADVAGCPKIGEVVEVGTITHAVAHNLSFDARMLSPHLNYQYGLCTLALARQYIKGTTNHKLETLKNELGFSNQQSHSALGDVYTTLDLLRYLVPKSGVPIETLFKRAEAPKVIHRMPFGKFKGLLLSKVPTDYRAWLLGQPGLDKDLKYTLEKLK